MDGGILLVTGGLLLGYMALELVENYVREEAYASLSARAKASLARALLTRPKLLFADELTANLDQHLGEQVERLLFDRYPQMALCCVAHRTYVPEGYTAVLRLAQGGMREVTP